MFTQATGLTQIYAPAGFRYRGYAPLTSSQGQRLPEEGGHVHPQGVGDEQQVRVLRIPLGVLVALDRPPLHAGEVRQFLLGELCLPP